jgi:isoquinoline 1-oxidoreductase subunit alpha
VGEFLALQLSVPATLRNIHSTHRHRPAGPSEDRSYGERSLIAFNLNGRAVEVDADPQMPLLWVLRDLLALTGTKYGCGIALCGACTAHLDGRPIRTCVLPVASAAGKNVTTIEGLSPNGEHPVQRAWVELDVVQCGYCQSGQVMSAAALIASNPAPSDEEIDVAMAGNICRCGTYQRIRAAIRRAAELARNG